MEEISSESEPISSSDLVQRIHDSPGQLVLAVAGAGHSALSNLLDVAGASRTLLEALVPYSNTAFNDFLAEEPAQYVAASTARLMAGRAYTRARQLTDATTPVIGVGCTATIATDRMKRGEHRAHIAVRQHEHMVEYYVQLEKGKRDRHGEETIVGQVILHAIATSYGIAEQFALPLADGDQLERTEIAYRPMVEALTTGEVHYMGIQADGTPIAAGGATQFQEQAGKGQLKHPMQDPQWRPISSGGEDAQSAPPVVILSGAFNPLHDGHIGMARAAEELLGQTVTFELAAVNVDKPPLPTDVILDRIGQFAGRYPILASDAPTYIGKAQLYPGATFVVGYDTAVRIFATRYYDNSAEKMLKALRQIGELGCKFLVAGRVDKGGVFRSIEDLAIPAEFQALFRAIPERLFRRDISSTELRAAQERGSR